MTSEKTGPAKHPLPQITQETIEAGTHHVQVFGMILSEEPSTTAYILAPPGIEPDFYDIELQQVSFIDDAYETATVLDEWENLTLAQANQKLSELETIYPGINIFWMQDL